jgi:hypothetical protein
MFWLLKTYEWKREKSGIPKKLYSLYWTEHTYMSMWKLKYILSYLKLWSQRFIIYILYNAWPIGFTRMLSADILSPIGHKIFIKSKN